MVPISLARGVTGYGARSFHPRPTSGVSVTITEILIPARYPHRNLVGGNCIKNDPGLQNGPEDIYRHVHSAPRHLARMSSRQLMLGCIQGP